MDFGWLWRVNWAHSSLVKKKKNITALMNEVNNERDCTCMGAGCIWGIYLSTSSQCYYIPQNTLLKNKVLVQKEKVY